MNQKTTSIVLAFLALFLTSAWAFSIQRTAPSVSSSSQLHVIRGEGEDGEQFDQMSGGVRLAKEAVIKIKGEVKHAPGKADAKPVDLLRYNKMTTVDESQVKSVLDKVNGSILCKGSGKEMYKDPGSGTDKIVALAPHEAIKDALNEAGSASKAGALVLNFLGGDDMIMMEVCQAANELVLDLDAATKTKIRFHSLSHSSIPAGTCTITAVISSSDDDSSADGLSGAEKAIASGELYFRDGQWYTVEEAEINTSVA